MSLKFGTQGKAEDGYNFRVNYFMAFPGGSVGKYQVCLQCRSPGFNSWVGNIPWRGEGLAFPAFLPGEFHRQRSLASYRWWGQKELHMTEQLTLSISRYFTKKKCQKLLVHINCNLHIFAENRWTQSLHCSPETITKLLIHYTPIQNKKFILFLKNAPNKDKFKGNFH